MKNLMLSFIALVFSSTLMAQVDVKLRITHRVGYDTLGYGQTYTHKSNFDYNITLLRYYLSGFQVHHDGITDTLNDTYILVESDSSEYDLGNLNITELEGISYDIGIPEDVNHLDPTQYAADHPLAPQSPTMHWGWTAGYKFIVVEGNADSDFNGTLDALYQMHVVGDEFLTPVNISSEGSLEGGTLYIDILADYKRMLKALYLPTVDISHGGGTNNTQLMENIGTNNVFRALPTTSFTCAADSIHTSGVSSDYDIYTPIRLFNEAGRSLNLEWERLSQNIPTGWDISSCDPEKCHDGSVSSSAFVLGTSDNPSDYINVHFYPNGIPGSAEASTRVWDPNNNDEFVLKFSGFAEVAAGIDNNEMNSGSIVVYPVPSNGDQFVQYSFSQTVNLNAILTNSTGQESATFNSLPASGQLELADQPKGLYILRFLDNGKQIGQVKLIR